MIQIRSLISEDRTIKSNSDTRVLTFRDRWLSAWVRFVAAKWTRFHSTQYGTLAFIQDQLDDGAAAPVSSDVHISQFRNFIFVI